MSYCNKTKFHGYVVNVTYRSSSKDIKSSIVTENTMNFIVFMIVNVYP